MNKFLLLSLLFLTACASKMSLDRSLEVVSMQTIDRNGFTETISSKDRLKVYQGVDFLSAQPYQKVLRVYGKDVQGKNLSRLTSYHVNGSAWQYLEALDGRANGAYLEWHENGRLKIDGHVIEGLADLSPIAQKSWLFDGPCLVFDEEGHKVAEFPYDKGHLEGEARYFFPNGTLQKTVFYSQGMLEGTFLQFDQEGNCIEEICFQKGVKEGAATAFWEKGVFKYQEQYREGMLVNAIYFDKEGHPVAEIENGQGIKAEFEQGWVLSLSEYKGGVAEGEVKLFRPNGSVFSTYTIKNGKKTGVEWEYYPMTPFSFSHEKQKEHPKLMISWHEDRIEGMVKTWYENGILESQRELSGNKKHGLSFAYYKNGQLMLMEEYENDKLVKGSYYKKGEETAVSVVEKGEGTATLYHPEGHFFKKVSYEKGRPIIE